MKYISNHKYSNITKLFSAVHNYTYITQIALSKSTIYNHVYIQTKKFKITFIAHINTYIHTHTYTYTYILYLCMYLHVSKFDTINAYFYIKLCFQIFTKRR